MPTTFLGAIVVLIAVAALSRSALRAVERVRSRRSACVADTPLLSLWVPSRCDSQETALRTRIEGAMRRFNAVSASNAPQTQLSWMLQDLLTADFAEATHDALTDLDCAREARDAEERNQLLAHSRFGVAAAEEIASLHAELTPVLVHDLVEQVRFLAPCIKEYREKASARVRRGAERGFPVDAAETRLAACGVGRKLTEEPEFEREHAIALTRLIDELLEIDACLLEVESIDACNRDVTRIGAARSHIRLLRDREATLPHASNANSRDPAGSSMAVQDKEGATVMHWPAVRRRIGEVARRVAALRGEIVQILGRIAHGSLEPVALCDQLIDIERRACGISADVNGLRSALSEAYVNLPRQSSGV